MQPLSKKDVQFNYNHEEDGSKTKRPDRESDIINKRAIKRRYKKKLNREIKNAIEEYYEENDTA